jgi:hypothetical protein
MMAARMLLMVSRGSVRLVFTSGIVGSEVEVVESALPLQTGYHSLLSVAVIQIEGADCAMLAATKHVPVAGKPPVKPVSERTNKWNLEQP